ncbi:hypothetical protein P7K49_031349 [Saguinus oedipus]|uniref:Uncharacterized protein n=1 Tax=Saguinus oedipus TaxID=9490 RepID=A0ABQ9TZ51_SAGOE|nr:hypothetical protein P7K49_031349 [Saguinus oedipus]
MKLLPIAYLSYTVIETIIVAICSAHVHYHLETTWLNSAKTNAARNTRPSARRQPEWTKTGDAAVTKARLRSPPPASSQLRKARAAGQGSRTTGRHSSTAPAAEARTRGPKSARPAGSSTRSSAASPGSARFRGTAGPRTLTMCFPGPSGSRSAPQLPSGGGGREERSPAPEPAKVRLTMLAALGEKEGGPSNRAHA